MICPIVCVELPYISSNLHLDPVVPGIDDQVRTKSSFSIALFCLTRRRIPARASSNEGPEKGDLIPQVEDIDTILNRRGINLDFTYIYDVPGTFFGHAGTNLGRVAGRDLFTAVHLGDIDPVPNSRATCGVKSPSSGA